MLEELKTLLAKYYEPHDPIFARLSLCVKQQNVKPFFVQTSDWSEADREEFGVLLKSLQQAYDVEKYQKKTGHVTWAYKEVDWQFAIRPDFLEGLLFIHVDALLAASLTKSEVMEAITDHVRTHQPMKKKRTKMEVSVHVARATATPYLITKITHKKEVTWRVIPS